jgi:hypothetical protein
LLSSPDDLLSRKPVTVRDIFLGKFDSTGQLKGIQISKSEKGFYSITSFICCGDEKTDHFILVPKKLLKDYAFVFSTPGEHFKKHL